MATLAPGLVVSGRFRLEKLLGQGGMGSVWLARHIELDAEVAIKFIRPERVAVDPSLLSRFAREAKAAARIAHPHVVQVRDYGTIDGTLPYLVMEFLRGFTLAELLARGGRLSLATAKSLVRQLAGALESAHAQGVVHRDITPHNVFITEGSRDYPLFVKVLDFGIAKIVGETQVSGGSNALTETGTVIGAPAYMSPEQLEGRSDVDLRADLWSLAVAIYETLTGALPFAGSSFIAVGAAVLGGRYPRVTALRPDLPPGIDDWFGKALCVDPAQRFASAAALASAFEELGTESNEADDAPALSSESAVRHDLRRSRAAPGTDPPLAFAATEHGPSPGAVPAGNGARSATSTSASSASALAPAPEASAAEPTAAHVLPAPRGSEAPAATGRRARRAVWLGGAGLAFAAGIAALFAVVLRAGHGASCPRGMSYIAGGTYRMGSDDPEVPTDDTPAHATTVSAFCLDTTEVTVAAYAACASCGAAPGTVLLEGMKSSTQSFESTFCNGPDHPEHPQNCVNWNQARDFCAAVGKRLPREDEWEYAARSSAGRIYPWGDTEPARERLNACGEECTRMLSERRAAIGGSPWGPAMYGDDDSAAATAPVGAFPAGASLAGVLDLAGNVWEWTESPFCLYGSEGCGDSRRVVRGGGWDTLDPAEVRATRRVMSAPTVRSKSIGFRCALSP